MRLTIFRHAQTAGNLEKRYLGATDEPLCETGLETACRRANELREAWNRARVSAKDPIAAGKALPVEPDVVYASPRLRCLQTARILFPCADIVIVPQLAEMDFGVFEGKNCFDLATDEDYRAWVEGGCVGRCPDGENRAEFVERIVAGLAAVESEAARRANTQAVIAAHAGTALAARFAERMGTCDYFDLRLGFCESIDIEFPFGAAPGNAGAQR
ncbi:histidine phosphatase family protein [Gordonibacter sp. Marseille-P4307]|uniref:histidine phosphatase family protein n=1 Tax=Gordonibacter sp. Marseille-P4307 TaxID=2161815 RepID=UPI000F53A533|nr:histidine phosphatase family protein [Gordonibacter sp. Marseille-P4307]